jgi:hypothetical protein
MLTNTLSFIVFTFILKESFVRCIKIRQRFGLRFADLRSNSIMVPVEIAINQQAVASAGTIPGIDSG